MAYTKTNWENLPSTNTPINATNLNKIEQGIYDNSQDIATNTQSINTLSTNKAPLDSPALTGTPTAPTAQVGTNTTQIATTAFVQSAVSPTVLFDNDNNVNNEVNLSDSVSNYTYIEILYKDTDGIYNSVKIKNPLNKIISMATNNVFGIDDTVYIKNAKATISNNKISITDGKAYFFTSAWTNQGSAINIRITQVLGYK